MPILRNPRHEKFALGLVEGKPASMAYAEAGYRANDANASRLLTGNDRIRERVAELQEQGAKRCVITLEILVAEAADIQAKALNKGSFSAAVSALTVKAKLAGFWDDRAENKNSNVRYQITDLPMTEEEWDEKFCRETVADGNGPMR